VTPVASDAGRAGEPEPIPPASGRRFVVAAGHQLAAEAGAEVVDRTGNLFDAAVAATLVSSVVEPHLFGPGGEITGLVHARGRTRVLAGSTVAPAAMTPAGFARLGLDLIPGDGLLPSGPPALLVAMVVLLRDLGTVPFAYAAEPAIRLAAEGFPVDRLLASDIADDAEAFRTMWPETAEVWMPDGAPPSPGAVIRQPALAETLMRLGDAGDHEAVLRELRTGFIAEAILRFAREPHPSSVGDHPSFLSPSDLGTFDVAWEDPVSWTDRHGRTICKAGAWTQGPMLLQHLAMMEAGLWTDHEPLEPELLHATLEAIKLAMADREGYYADPRTATVPLEDLLSPMYATDRAGLIDPERADAPGPGTPRPGLRPWDGSGVTERAARSGDTTHLDLADDRGNAAALTPSGGWFSSPVIPELGFPLGTRCQTFWLDPTHPNALAPGKRPRTTLTPTLVLRDGRIEFVLGTPGGDAQDQIQAQLIHALAHGWAPEDAVDMPTVISHHSPSSFFPHSALPLRVDAETRIGREALDDLAARGHDIVDVGPWGHIRPQIIQVDTDGTMNGAVSRRFGTGGVIAT
jgi:gamma-glutamyltranspeptidase / glutathione hydrolase